MSSQITTAHVEQYKKNVIRTVQQSGSRLRGAVKVDANVVGKSKFCDLIGATEMQERTSRHGDSPMMNTPHLRRRLDLSDFHWGDMIDEQDKVRMLIDPTSDYVMNAADAAGRKIDDLIFAAMRGTAITGQAGGSSVVWSTGATAQHVASTLQDGTGSSATGLNLAKLRRARKILRAAEVSPREKLFCAVNAQMIDNLLQTTQVGSSDYNSIKALVDGNVNSYMGFQFIHTERVGLLNHDTTTDESCWCWAQSGIELGIGSDVKTRAGERPDKEFNTYVYLKMTMGATRIEEEKLVEIACDPTAGITAA